MSFDAAVETLRSGITELFAPYALGGQGELAFYPSRLRNPIMEAGTARKLIRVTYHGVTRIMEPYSLVYKRRKDGVAQEYLCLGPHRGIQAPGIKTLMHYDVQALDVLEETFEPQFEVTLSKAGDSSQSGSFAGNRRPRTAPRRATTRRLRTQVNPKYVIQCGTSWQALHARNELTRLNLHKNSWGSSCPGRAGFPVAIR